jgi:hypothetical protein
MGLFIVPTNGESRDYWVRANGERVPNKQLSVLTNPLAEGEEPPEDYQERYETKDTGKQDAVALLNDPYIDRGYRYVALIKNGDVDTLGIAFNKAELNAYITADGRPMEWFKVPTQAIEAFHPTIHSYMDQ